MIKDISIIRKELDGFEEIELPYDFEKGCLIKYITLDKKDDESFYLGGNYENLGDNCIILKKGLRTWAAPMTLKNPDGSTRYTSRFFVKEAENKCTKEIQELKDTIHYQQSIIETMTQKLAKLEVVQQTISQEKKDYEELLQQNRYNFKEKCIEAREKDETIKRYEEIIQKLTHSHHVFN